MSSVQRQCLPTRLGQNDVNCLKRLYTISGRRGGVFLKSETLSIVFFAFTSWLIGFR